MAIVDRAGLPVAIDVGSATPHEVTLVEQVLDQILINVAPTRLIGDKAYDSDGLDERLRDVYGTEMIAPNRTNRKQTQDGRPLRRYRRRWKVERLFAWLHNFRRIVVRYEYYLANYRSMVLLGCIVILLRRF